MSDYGAFIELLSSFGLKDPEDFFIVDTRDPVTFQVHMSINWDGGGHGGSSTFVFDSDGNFLQQFGLPETKD